MGTILPKLYSIYRAAGCDPLTGYSPYHFFNFRDIQFTRFMRKDGLHGIPGIALQEVMFIEHFREFISPQRILVVGNAHGWSTIALSLIFPDAKTVAIDIDPVGVDFTNGLIAASGLSAKAVTARSPDDVAAVVGEHLGGPVDFSFVDAIHSNETLTADFAAVKAVAADQAVHLFHDVINWNMIAGLSELLRTHRLQGKVFTRTASGMALAHSGLSAEFEAYLDCFTDKPGIFRTLRQFCLENYVDPIKAYQAFDVPQ
jgi:predicted O-methyltransferase YrrM